MANWILRCCFVLLFSPAAASDLSPQDLALLRELVDVGRYAQSDPVTSWGRELFNSSALSASGISCASCHVPEKGWTERLTSRPTPQGERRTPSLLGSKYTSWQAWDGKSPSIEFQVLNAFKHELGLDADQLHQAIHANNILAREYSKAFDFGLPKLECASPNCAGQLTAGHAVFAVSKFIKSISSGCTPFDVNVLGLISGAVSPSKKWINGARLFVGKAGCITCHDGPGLTDGEFHNTGVVDKHSAKRPDSGRAFGLREAKRAIETGTIDWIIDKTKLADQRKLAYFLRDTDALWGQFKTPSLRGVAGRAPYMHNGAVESLADVLEHYDSGGRSLTQSSWEPIRNHHSETVLKPLGLSPIEKEELTVLLESLSVTSESERLCPSL